LKANSHSYTVTQLKEAYNRGGVLGAQEHPQGGWLMTERLLIDTVEVIQFHAWNGGSSLFLQIMCLPRAL